MADKQPQFNTLWSELKTTFKLNVDYAKLTAAEKLTLLLTSVSLALLAFVLLSIIMFFMSLALVRCIATGVGMIWAYVIMGAFYIVLLAVIVLFRKQLIVNPISRFVSRLFFNP